MKREYSLLFLVLSFLSLPNLVNICKSYIRFPYDAQVFLTWAYSASTGMLPYKDISYPGYGFLIYLKGENLFFPIIYFLLTPFLLTYLFFIINKVFKDRLFSYFSLIILFLFIKNITGFEIFSRYGTSIVVASLFAWMFYNYKNTLQHKKILFAGILNGFILPLLYDQGLYIFVLFFLLLITDKVLREGTKKKNSWYYKIINDGLIYIIGFLVGFLPFFAYLISHNIFYQFANSFSELSDVTLFAKTPFIHSIGTTDNIFTLVSLFLSISFLSYTLIYKKAKASLNTYIQLALIFVLIIVEQKNVIRNIDTEFTFIGLLLFIFLFYELKVVLQKYKLSNVKIFIYFVNFLLIISFLIGIHPYGEIANTRYCQSNNRFVISDSRFVNVKKIVDTLPEFNGKIFSFPGDTVFYILFKQHMPFYATSYEGSSLKAQKKTIQYIKDNKIKYIIYNYKNYAIQDTVPNVVRSILLNRYILNNYSIDTSVGDFLILQKNQQEEDFFANKELNSFPGFKKSLLQVDLENIPRSEGLYKMKYLSIYNTNKVFPLGSIKDLNDYLRKNKTNSENKLVVIQFIGAINNKQKAQLTLKTNDNLETNIIFSKCEENIACIINLVHIPIFYQNRFINSISIDKNSKITEISLMNISDESHFW